MDKKRKVGMDGEDGSYAINPSDLKGFDGDDGCYELNPSDFKGFDGDDGCYVISPSDFKCKKSLLGLEDIAIIAEKGPVPLRDYPHPRHLCFSFPFHSTPHQSYCTKCYCYVCETRAPCLDWLGSEGHCHVTKVSKEDTVYNSIRK
ncbi:RPM1 interacting protein 13-like [Magnolia sinica]|uniref:RPM1 interacting protein 13-like n=1 Tax=Magnolia sinica TaxID=86752 RepID=UPI0026597C6C|nr:RPM1 interacting protein 13-like [Magnolia sinica]